jgi:hypothetical protein
MLCGIAAASSTSDAARDSLIATAAGIPGAMRDSHHRVSIEAAMRSNVLFMSHRCELRSHPHV